MATQDLTPLTGSVATARVALEATAANAREVLCPVWANQMTVTFVQSDGATADTGKIAGAGVDGSAMGNNHFPVSSGGALAFSLRGNDEVGGAKSVYLSAGTNSAFAYVIFEAARA